jgi:hypothetical protein
MTLFGEKGDTGKLRLPAKRNAFERGGIDTFQLSAKDVGKIWTLRIGHNNRGSRPSWHVDKVQVVVEGDNCGVYYFAVEQWFDSNRGDGLTEREIPASLTEPKKRVKYRVTTYTSDISNAGTDGEVSVVLRERNGLESGPHKLAAGFERGAEDVFSISCPSKLGDLGSLLVVFDGKKKWHLELIVVEEDSTGRKCFFPCGHWIGSDRGVGTGQNLELGAVGTDPRLERNRYKVMITTSNVEGAGTDGDVFVTMIGEKGEGKEHVLESAGEPTRLLMMSTLAKKLLKFNIRNSRYDASSLLIPL